MWNSSGGRVGLSGVVNTAVRILRNKCTSSEYRTADSKDNAVDERAIFFLFVFPADVTVFNILTFFISMFVCPFGKINYE